MYKIVGTDRKEYGPVTSERVREWIAQGRANGETIARFEEGPWKPLSTFPEFADALRGMAPPPLAQGYGGTIPGAIPAYQVTGAEIKSSSVSVWGLTLSILGLFCLCFPFSVAGIICSTIGLMDINKEPHKYTTNKMIPIIGLVIGIIGLLGLIVGWATGAFRHLVREF
jgi:hypothetical protein